MPFAAFWHVVCTKGKLCLLTEVAGRPLNACIQEAQSSEMQKVLFCSPVLALLQLSCSYILSAQLELDVAPLRLAGQLNIFDLSALGPFSARVHQSSSSFGTLESALTAQSNSNNGLPVLQQTNSHSRLLFATAPQISNYLRSEPKLP